MKQIKNSEYEEFQKYLHDKNNGRILTPDGLRLICQANDYDSEKFGKHMLEVMARQQSEQARTSAKGCLEYVIDVQHMLKEMLSTMKI